MSDKELRIVEILSLTRNTSTNKYSYEGTGVSAKFHQFGVDYEESDTGPGNFSTAIVEMDDGTVKNLPVHLIRFLS